MQVAYSVDVAVLGGGTQAVSAAVAAAEAGASVFLAATRPHLGEDVCDTLRLELEDGQGPETELARRIFPDGLRTSPLHVKKALDRALADAGVRFLFGCYATDVLRDGAGAICGFAMANRSGRQAVLARTVIDATDRAWFAVMAGAQAEPWPGGEQVFERTLVAGRDGQDPQLETRRVRVEMPGRRFADFAGAEQEARDAAYIESQLQSADCLFQVPPDALVCERGPEEWTGAVDVGHLRPTGAGRVYVLGGRAGVPREVARQWLRPGGLMAVGAAVGRAAAREAAEIGECAAPRLVEAEGGDGLSGEVREELRGLRPAAAGADEVEASPRVPQVLAECGVVVVGGGTSGAAAAIAAARTGADVLLVEYQRGLGGMGTLGLIGKPYHGLRAGFGREVPFPDDERGPEPKMEWYRRQVRDAGGRVWFGVLCCGAYVEGNRVRGAVVATPEGRGVILADAVIDATGNADIAAAAGARTLYGATEDGDIAMQGAGLPTRPLGRANVNTDYLFVDESDAVDAWRALAGARRAMEEGPFDVGPLLQTRERRRIVGDHVLEYLDQIAGRTYPDSIVLSCTDYDAHGYPNHPYFALMPHTEQWLQANHPAPGGSSYTPYRCLLPRGLEGILVIGLGTSMTRDACGLMRMQHDLANQGYAAGMAAAIAAADGTTPRAIDVRALQRRLVEAGNLPAEVLTHEDSFPLPEQAVAAAARRLTSGDRADACKALAIVLSHAEIALPHLRAAHQSAVGDRRLRYALVLGSLGERDVVDELSAALREAQWDSKVLQGRMAEYAHLPTPTDSIVLALGRTGDARALPAIREKMDALDAATTLSHHRAVALALERIGDPAAAPELARLLGKPGMSGHTMHDLVALPDRPMEARHREAALREIVLARALYRCGDHDGLGERILHAYAGDLRALFRRHAESVLTGTETDRWRQ